MLSLEMKQTLKSGPQDLFNLKIGKDCGGRTTIRP